MRRALTALVAALALGGCSTGEGAPMPGDGVARLVPVVVAEHPHDPAAFTQGLELLEPGVLVESTGLYGQSQVRMVEVATGQVVASADLPDDQFGEGLTIVGDQVRQLTWESGVAHAWALPGLRPAGTTSYRGQGWGLCEDEGAGIAWRSDGSSVLVAHDPATMEQRTERIEVTVDGSPVEDLNELECAGGSVWANIWKSDLVVEIDPATGEVASVVDASALREAVQARGVELDANQVLNGIAHDPATGHWYLTGKQWPVLFEVRFEASTDATGGTP